MNNQQKELEASNPQAEEIAILEDQLREAIAAEEFFNTASGKLWVKIATKEIDRIVKEITSDKYRDDLPGYNNALSDLNAYRKQLRMMQIAGSPVRKAKIQERLDDGK